MDGRGRAKQDARAESNAGAVTEERGDEAISNRLLLIYEIAALRSQ